MIPLTTKIQIYNTLVLPYLSYCIPVWGGTFQSHIEPLVVLQKRAIRIICRKPYLEPTSALFFACKILKLKDLYDYSLNLRFFKTKCYEEFIFSSGHFTRNMNNMRLPFHRLALTQHSVSRMGAIAWRNLPMFIRTSTSLPAFKKKTKTFYVDRYV